MRDYMEYKRQREELKARYERRHGVIKSTPQYNERSETRSESVREEEEIREPEIIEERENIEKGEKSAGSFICEELRREGHKGSGKKKENIITARGMYNEGWTQTAIAKELGCSRRSVYRYLFYYK